jgi:hypothetical protein
MSCRSLLAALAAASFAVVLGGCSSIPFFSKKN